MMSITHAAIAITITSLTLGTADPTVLGCAVIGSQFPDLDTTESLAGKVLYPVARFIEQRYSHRTLTHSFLSTLAIAIIASPLYAVSWNLWAGIVLGQFLGWFADCFTKSGCAAFFPNPARLVIPGNPRARLSTQSSTEYWLLGIIVLMGVVSINLSSAGGLTEQFAIAFMPQTSTAAKLFNKYGSERLVQVSVTGQNITTTRAVNERFIVLEATDSDIIGESQISGKLFKIGTAPDVQIQPSSVRAELGKQLAIATHQQQLQEIGVGDWLQRISAAAYISGSLLLEDMGELRLTLPIGEYPSMRVFGGQLELSNARPYQLQQIREFWILSGQVVIKERR